MCHKKMPKRSRTESGSSDSRRKRAIAIAAKTRAKWPYSDYGIAHYKRGAVDTRDIFGETYRSASSNQKLRRKSLGYVGRGKYWSNIKPFLQKNIPQGSFGNIGEMYAGKLGRSAGNALARYSGFGEYTANQLVTSGGVTPTQISVNSSVEQDLVLERTEYIGNVISHEQFHTDAYIINAAHSDTFPWGANIARLYETYQFEGLMFQYKPLISEETAQQSGKVILATAYDPYFSGFVNDQQMSNYAYANSDRPSRGLVHGVETARMQVPQSMLYNRINNEIESTRPKDMSDLAIFYVGTNNPSLTPGLIMGELWVTYKVRLSRPLAYISTNTTTVSNPSFPVSFIQYTSGITSNKALSDTPGDFYYGWEATASSLEWNGATPAAWSLTNIGSFLPSTTRYFRFCIQSYHYAAAGSANTSGTTGQLTCTAGSPDPAHTFMTFQLSYFGGNHVANTLSSVANKHWSTNGASGTGIAQTVVVYLMVKNNSPPGQLIPDGPGDARINFSTTHSNTAWTPTVWYRHVEIQEISQADFTYSEALCQFS